MAAGDREATFILRASDLSSQPVNQVTEALQKLLAQQKLFVEASKAGTANTAEFNKALNDLSKGGAAVARQIADIERYQKAIEGLQAREIALAAAQQRRVELMERRGAGNTLDKSEQSELKRLEGSGRESVEKLQTAADKFRSGTLAPLEAQMARIGVTFATSSGALKLLRELLDSATTGLVEMNAADRVFLENKRNAAAAVKAQAEAEAELTQQRKAATAAEDAENAAFVARNRAAKQAETERLAAAEKSMAAANAAKGVRGDRQADIRAAFAEADAEKVIATERENAAKKEDAAFVARNRAERAAEAERLAAAEKSMAAANAAKGVRGDREADIRAAFAEADAEKVIATERENAAKREDAAFVARNRAERAAEQTRLAEAEKAMAAADEFKNRRKSIREDDLRAAFAEYDTEQKLNSSRIAAYAENVQHEEALAKQRNMAAQAGLSLPGRQPLGVSGTPPADFSSASQGIAGIIAPAATARSTINGLEAEIENLAEQLTKGKLRVEDYATILRTLGLSYEALKKQANLIDLYRTQEEATRRAETAMRQEAAALAALQDRVRNATGAEKGFEAELTSVAKAARDAASAFNQENERLAVHRTALDAAGISYINLDAAIVRLNTSATIGRKVFDEATGKTGGGKDAVFLGLRPYELQNLSYQINDVITQLSSGTSLSQTLAQQGGQIFQLFQKQLVSAFQALKDIPFGIAGASVAIAGLTLGVLALVRAMDEAAARRLFAGQLAASVDGATQSVKGLTGAALAIEKMGINFSEAAKGAAEFAKVGFTADKIAPLLAISANISRTFGKPMADAVKEVNAAFAGGYDAMRKFASEYNILTDRQDKRIHDLFTENDAERAHNELLNIATQQFEKARKDGVSPLSDALDRIHNNWVALMRTLGDNALLTGITNFFATAIHGADNLAKAIARVHNAVPGMISADMAGVAGVAAESGIPGRTGGGTGRTPNAGPSPAGAEFTAARDQTAAAVGLSRQALALLQNSEGQWKDNKWQDSHSGAIGPMQILQSTFDELKKKYPELIKGTIHDVETNLMAGALYFRDILKQTGGDFKEAVLGYKNGPGTVTGGGTPEQMAARRARINAKDRADNDASAADLAGAVTAPPLIGGTNTPQTQAGATGLRNWKEEQDRATAAMKQTGLSAEEILKRQGDLIDESNRKVVEEAQKTLGVYAESEEARTNIARVQAERRQIILHGFEEERLRNDLEVTSELQELRNKELNADKTNLAARLAAVNETFDKIDKKIANQNFEGKFPTRAGTTFEQAQQVAADARSNERAQVAVDVAKEVVARAVAVRDDAVNIVKAQLANPNTTAAQVPTLLAKLAQIQAENAPKIAEAVQKSNFALVASGRNTPDVQAQRARNDLTLEQSKQAVADKGVTGQGISLVEETTRATLDQRVAEVSTVTARVKSGATTFAQGLTEVTALLGKSLPEMARTTAEGKAALERIRDLPTTSAADRAKINDRIAQDALALAKAPQAILKFITEGIADEEEKFTKLLKQYHDAMEDLARRVRNGITSPVAAAAERARINADMLPKIQAAGTALAADKRAAAATPGLPSGEVQSLTQGAAAAEQQSSPRNAELESTRKGVEESMAELSKLRQANREMEATQKELLAKNMTGTFEAEEAIRQQYEETNKAAAKIVPTLDAQITRMKELGASDSEIAKLRGQFKLLGTDMTYTSQFSQQLGKTLTDSIGNRGMQAIDKVAEALGNLAAHGGKLKDVWAAVGQAFAEFTAGVLKDVATMIIKFYLMAAIKSALGIASGGSTTAFDAMLGAGTAATKHGGGIVGDPTGSSRVVDLSLFRAARRMHAGGVAGGLTADEVPTILRKGELVLTEAQQRAQAAQQSGNGTGQTGIRNVLAVGDKEIAGAMNSSHGERTIMNVLQRNAPTVKKWVG